MDNKKKLFYILCAVCYSIAIVFAIEIMQRGSIREIIEWIQINETVFLFNCFIVLLISVLVFMIIGRLFYTVTLVSVVLILVGLINISKKNMLGDPFLPWDIFFAKQLIEILPIIFEGINFKYILYSIIGIVIIVMLKRFLPDVKIAMKYRIVVSLFSTLLLILLSFYSITPLEKVFNKLGIQNVDWKQDYNYLQNGVLLSFFMNVPNAIVLAPTNYSEKKMGNITNEILGIDDKYLINDDVEKPNIIVIMSEAFWDVKKFQNLSFSEDPISTTRSNLTGHILSPEFGGYTANVEFEFLTGLSNTLLPSGSIPYQQYVKSPIPSIASTLKDVGFRSIAIHTYPEWYYDREKVYQRLGFDEFISQEKFIDPPIKGAFIADSVITNKIIEEVEKTDDPLFSFAVTMQNHGPYTGKRYEENSINIDGDISEESIETLETYTQGIRDADGELNNLISYFSNSSEPTMIVFFGDHLPLLGDEYAIYKEAGYIDSGEENWTLETQAEMKKTPLVIWKNYDKTYSNLDVISPSFLGPIIFEEANINQPKYYNFLRSYSEKISGYTKEVKVDFQGSNHKEVPASFEDLEETYKLIQYDILFGEQYSKEQLFFLKGD